MTSTTTDFSTLTGTYAIDASHSRFGFVARHAMVTKVRGSFNEFEGTATIDGANPDELLRPGDDRRRQHRHPQRAARRPHPHQRLPRRRDATRRSPSPRPSIKHDGGNDFEVTGDLTIRGVTKSITLPLEFQGAATDPFGNARIGFEGSVVINRKDWGVNWNAALEAGGVLVSEKVTLEFEISAIKTA